MKRTNGSARRVIASAVSAALLLTGLPARADEQTIELRSRGGNQSYRLPDGTTEVELVEQLAGGCRFGRTWGYDLSAKSLWVDGGCGGRFKLTTAAPEGNRDGSSNVGAAIAAAAVIAGIALIASSKDRKDRDDRPDDPYPGNPGNGWGAHEIRGKGNLCLDIEGGARRGRGLIVYSCNGGGNQRFEWGRGGELRVSGLCLDVENGSNRDGARVIAYDCNGNRNQRWRARGGEIRSADTGKCLDIDAGRARPGQRVIMYSCNGNDNQRWSW